MTLTPGTLLGVYEISAKLGEGGMGAVFRARDTKLDRDVAIKILPEAFAHDADRVARFTREAKTLASLNHPNIAAIYGLEESGGITALVMELVEGEDLSEVIARHRRGSGPPSPGVPPGFGERGRSVRGGPAPRGQAEAERGRPEAASVSERLREGDSAAERRGWGPAATKESGRPGAGTRQSGPPRGLSQAGLPLDDALAIARQIAEALEAAHEQGIIHRDLKPANIKVRADGTVKVLDFGLAKAVAPAGTMSASASMSPTITSPAMTEMGMILGTAAYMSPEQARGKAVDKRADIWAFGVVFYEMLTGQRAFQGEDVSLTLAAVLRAEVNFDALPVDTPARVRQVLTLCLQRDLKRRVPDIGAVRLALEGAFETVAPQATAAAAMPRGRLMWVVWACSVVALALAAAAALYLRPASATGAPTRLSVVPPANRPIALGWSPGNSLALSPDGAQIVYVGANLDAPANRPGGRNQLQVRSLATLAVRDLPGTTDARQPLFSPDGQWIAFFTGTGDLKKVSLDGGPPVTLLSKINASSWAFGVWTEDNTIIFSSTEPGRGLRRVSAEGGAATDLTSPDAAQGESLHLYPALVPSGRIVLFTVAYSDGRAPRIEALMLDSGERRVVVENAGNGRVLGSGHLLFRRNDTSLIAPFDTDRLTITGPAIPLADDRGQAVSPSGTFAYIPAADAARTLGLVGRDGTFEPLGPPPDNFELPRVSPDGRSIAYVVRRGWFGDVYVYDLARGSTTKLTQDGGDTGPAWHPDGRSLALMSTRGDVNGIFLKNLDGAERLLVPRPATASVFRQPSWSPDGMRLAYTLQTGSLHDIWILTMGDTPTSQPFLDTAASERSPRFSPDGRWLAYVSDESGRLEVYVRGYPQGDRFAVSTSGGDGPVWSRDGRALFFEGNVDDVPKLMTASVTPDGASLRVGNPLPLFDRRVPGPTGMIEQYASNGNNGVGYDVLPDGRFVMVRGPDPNAAREIVVVQHWFEELKRLVPTD